MPSSWEMQFRELRKQFDEKSKVHHLKCKQLFSQEAELLIQKRELEEASFDNDRLIASWQHDLQVLLEENARLQEENALLEEIISRKENLPPSVVKGGSLKNPIYFLCLFSNWNYTASFFSRCK